mgnify:CR=1 FL=1
MRLAKWGPAATRAASSKAARSTASRSGSSGTTRLASPICRQRSAGTRSPSSRISEALPSPTTRGSSQLAPISAPDRPTCGNRNEKKLPCPMTRRSLARAITAPAPAATRFTLAIAASPSKSVGEAAPRLRLRLFSTPKLKSLLPATISSPVIRVKRSRPSVSRANSRVMMSSTSPPLQNARPSPCNTSARAPSGSWPRRSITRNRSVSSRYTSKVSALKRSGRVSVITPTRARSS